MLGRSDKPDLLPCDCTSWLILACPDWDNLRWDTVKASGSKPAKREMHAAFVRHSSAGMSRATRGWVPTASNATHHSLVTMFSATAADAPNLLVIVGGRGSSAVLGDTCLFDLGMAVVDGESWVQVWFTRGWVVCVRGRRKQVAALGGVYVEAMRLQLCVRL